MGDLMMRSLIHLLVVAIFSALATGAGTAAEPAPQSPPSPEDGASGGIGSGLAAPVAPSLAGTHRTYVEMLRKLSEPDSGTSGPAALPAGGTGPGSSTGPLPGFPMLAVRGSPEQGVGLLRAGPALDQAMRAMQAGDSSGGVRILRDAVDQVDRARSRYPGLVEGKQSASLRHTLSVAGSSEECAPTPTKGSGVSIGAAVAVAVPLLTAIAGAALMSDPVLLDMDEDGVADVTTPTVTGGSEPFVKRGAVWFDLGGRGRSTLTEWLVPGHDGLLALDANGNGVIDNASELFGDRDGFADGFAKLALLDTDHDGRLTRRELSNLSVWIDVDGDGICRPGELSGVAALGITSLGVTHDRFVSSFERRGKTCRMWNWFPRTAR
ncbi:MAG: hypothetical protein HY815_05675 [Candidatus Riflebacteria bacterium]|nr:hypothetical protein [Candidatus Riflebacteria bacterium]